MGRRLVAIALTTVMAITFIGMGVLSNGYSDVDVDINNLAGSTTKHVTYSGAVLC